MFKVGDASIIKTLLHLKLLNMTLSLSARSSSVQETVLVTGSDCAAACRRWPGLWPSVPGAGSSRGSAGAGEPRSGREGEDCSSAAN